MQHSCLTVPSPTTAEEWCNKISPKKANKTKTKYSTTDPYAFRRRCWVEGRFVFAVIRRVQANSKCASSYAHKRTTTRGSNTEFWPFKVTLPKKNQTKNAMRINDHGVRFHSNQRTRRQNNASKSCISKSSHRINKLSATVFWGSFSTIPTIT